VREKEREWGKKRESEGKRERVREKEREWGKKRESEGKRERVRDRNIVFPLISIYIKYFPKHK
jgi:hypothetical protein